MANAGLHVLNSGGRVTADLPPILKSNPLPADIDHYRDDVFAFLRMQSVDKCFTVSPGQDDQDKALGEREKVFYALLSNIHDQLLRKNINIEVQKDSSWPGRTSMTAADGSAWDQSKIRSDPLRFFKGCRDLITWIEDRKTPCNLSTLMKAVLDVEQARCKGGLDEIQNFRSALAVLQSRVDRVRERLSLTNDAKFKQVQDGLRALERSGLSRAELEKILAEYNGQIEDLTETKVNELLDQAVARRDVAKQQASNDRFQGPSNVSIHALHQTLGIDTSFGGCHDASCQGCPQHQLSAQEHDPAVDQICALIDGIDLEAPGIRDALPTLIAAVQKRKKDFGAGRHISGKARDAHSGPKNKVVKMKLTPEQAFSQQACIICGDTRHTAHKCQNCDDALKLAALRAIRTYLDQQRKSRIAALEEYDAQDQESYDEILAICQATNQNPASFLGAVTDFSTGDGSKDQDGSLETAWQAALDYNNDKNSSVPATDSGTHQIGAPIAALVEVIQPAPQPVSTVSYADINAITRVQKRLISAECEDDHYEFADIFPLHGRIAHGLMHTPNLDFSNFMNWRVHHCPGPGYSDFPIMVDDSGVEWRAHNFRIDHVPTYSLPAPSDSGDSSSGASIISQKEAQLLRASLIKSKVEPLESDIRLLTEAEDRENSRQLCRERSRRDKATRHRLDNDARHKASIRKAHTGGSIDKICDAHIAEHQGEDARMRIAMSFENEKTRVRHLLTDATNIKIIDFHFSKVAREISLAPSAYLDLTSPIVHHPAWPESSASAPVENSVDDLDVWSMAHHSAVVEEQRQAQAVSRMIRRTKSDPAFIRFAQDQLKVRDAICSRLESDQEFDPYVTHVSAFCDTLEPLVNSERDYPPADWCYTLCREPNSPLSAPRACSYEHCATTGFCGQCDDGYTCPWIPPTPPSYRHGFSSLELFSSATHGNYNPISAVVPLDVRESNLKADPGNPLHVPADSGACDSVSGPRSLGELAAAASVLTGTLPKTVQITPKTYQGVGGALIASTESTMIPLKGGGSIGFRSLDGQQQQPLIGRPGLQQLGVVSDWVHDRYLSVNDPRSSVTTDQDGKVTISGYWHDHRVCPNGHRAVDLSKFVQTTDIAATVETHQAFVTDVHSMGQSFLFILFNGKMHSVPMLSIDSAHEDYITLRTQMYRRGIAEWLQDLQGAAPCELVIDQHRCPSFHTNPMVDSSAEKKVLKILTAFKVSFAPVPPAAYAQMDRITASLLSQHQDRDLAAATRMANDSNQLPIASVFH